MHRLAFTSAISIVAVVVLFFIVCVAGPIESKVSKGLYLSLAIIVLIKHTHFAEPLPRLRQEQIAFYKALSVCWAGWCRFHIRISADVLHHLPITQAAISSSLELDITHYVFYCISCLWIIRHCRIP